MRKFKLSCLLVSVLAAASSADEKIVAWWSSIHHAEIFDPSSGVVQPADHGFTDILLGAYAMPLDVGSAHFAKIRAMSQAAPDGVRLWIMVHWAGGSNTSRNTCTSPVYDKYSGTIRDYLEDTGDVFRPYVDGDGIVYDAAPCPTWSQYWRWQTERIRRLSMMMRFAPNVVGIVLDAELYLSNRCTSAPHISRYPDRCYCRYCQRIGLANQAAYITQLAANVRGSTELKLGVANGDGLILGSEQPVPIYAAIHEAWQPTYQFTEQYYARGFSDSDGLGGSVVNYGSWRDIWTDSGRRDVRIVIGLNVRKLFAVDRDRRYVDRLPGLLEAFRWQVWGCVTYADGVFAYWSPYRIPRGQTFCPGDCCCKGGECGPFDASLDTFLEAFRESRTPPPNPCDYQLLPNGMYAVETIDVSGEVIRRMVAPNAPCYPPQVRANNECNR